MINNETVEIAREILIETYGIDTRELSAYDFPDLVQLLNFVFNNHNVEADEGL